MDKLRSLCSWYWVLASLWLFGVGLQTLVPTIVIPSVIMGALALLAGIFWFFSPHPTQAS